MKYLIWLTDIHFNFVQEPQKSAFLAMLAHQYPDAILISGDIGETYVFADYLREIGRMIARPVYFVLGNHDFYGGTLAGARHRARELTAEGAHPCWLSGTGVIELTPTTGLVGHEGWADARLGNYEASSVMLSDYTMIEDLSYSAKEGRQKILNRLGDETAKHIKQFLPEALERYEHVIFLTHVPPFQEACWYQGAVSNDEWLPHMACKASGDAILECMKPYPHRRLTVLCGHTHSPGEIHLRENIRVVTGKAKYGWPAIAGTLCVD